MNIRKLLYVEQQKKVSREKNRKTIDGYIQ